MAVIDLKPVRERILDAAVEHYYAEGIRAVSADKLIAAAHVSKVTFYRHFPTKDDLIAAYVAVRAEDEREAVTAESVIVTPWTLLDALSAEWKHAA